MKIINLDKTQHVDAILNLWKEELKSIYPLTKELMERNLENYLPSASFVIMIEEKLIGFIIGKVWNDSFKLPAYDNIGWISLIYVQPSYRKQGFGTKLIESSERAFKSLGKQIINIGKDLHNFFPGLPADLHSSLSWFQKRGYIYNGNSYDLIRCKNLGKVELVNNNNEFVFRIANIEDKNNILDFINRNWPGRWLKETIEYFEKGGLGNEYQICLDKGKVIAFAKLGLPSTKEENISYSLTWRNRFRALGGIGPLGVDKEYRGHHLGFDIVAASVNTMIDNNASDIIIDWTGLLDFYRKLGFEVWKTYEHLEKKI